MNCLTLQPLGCDVQLPHGSPLTELEYELPGQPGIPFGCKAGACGSCVIEVLKGGENLGVAGDDEKQFLQDLGYNEPRYRLACQCSLQGDVTINTEL